MAINKAISTRPQFGRGRAFSRGPAGPAVTGYTATPYITTPVASGLVSGTADALMPAWNLGLGYAIDCTGQMLFNADASGGTLSNVLLRNTVGGNIAYIGLNTAVPNASGGIPITSGNQIQFNDTYVNKVWAICASGLTTTLFGEGLFRQDRTKIM